MAVVLTVAVRTTLGLPPSVWEVVAAFGVALAPALLVLTVFRGAPPQTVAEVLYDAEHTTNPRARASSRDSTTNCSRVHRHLLQRTSRDTLVDRPGATNAFEFVVLSSLRAAQLMRGCTPRVDGPARP